MTDLSLLVSLREDRERRRQYERIPDHHNGISDFCADGRHYDG